MLLLFVDWLSSCHQLATLGGDLVRLAPVVEDVEEPGLLQVPALKEEAVMIIISIRGNWRSLSGPRTMVTDGDVTIIYFYFCVNFRKDIDSMESYVLSTEDGIHFLNTFTFSFSSSFNILCILITAEFKYLSVLVFLTLNFS